MQLNSSKAKNPIWRECKHCDNKFAIYPFEIKRAYCSHKCFTEAHRRTSKCPTCGTERILQKKKPQKDFCSLKCWGIAERVRSDYACKHCKKMFRPRKKTSQYCSKECFNKHKTLPISVKKKRMVDRVREYRRKNPELSAMWKHKRRAREMGAEGHFNKEEWIALKEKNGQRCAICKRKEKLTVDHIIPLSKNGTNYISNIQPLCMPCNSKKHVKIG